MRVCVRGREKEGGRGDWRKKYSLKPFKKGGNQLTESSNIPDELLIDSGSV